jgi:hypothetical protein
MTKPLQADSDRRCACGATLWWEHRETPNGKRWLALCTSSQCGAITAYAFDPEPESILQTFLKESGIYNLVPEGVRDMLFRDLPPQEPEIWLLRSLLVERMGQSPPPGWKAKTTREEAIAQLQEMFRQECVAC